MKIILDRETGDDPNDHRQVINGIKPVNAWNSGVGPFYIAVLLLITGCHPIHDESNCEDEVISSRASADGQILATATRRNCGSTTKIANIIYLQKINEKNKNKFGDKIFASTNESNPELLWTERTLSIKSPKTSNEIFLSNSKWKDVDIIYTP